MAVKDVTMAGVETAREEFRRIGLDAMLENYGFHARAPAKDPFERRCLAPVHSEPVGALDRHHLPSGLSPDNAIDQGARAQARTGSSPVCMA